MAIQREVRTIHWDYVLAMEEDLIRLSRFVDFSANDSTYSIEIARVMMAAAAEADVALKGICKNVGSRFSGRTIRAYYPVIRSHHPGLFDAPVSIERYGLTLRPWSDWTEMSPPLWWTANNKVKHERSDRFTDANLKNCLNAVAGVFAAVLYLHRDLAEQGELLPVPALLGIPGSPYNGMGAHPVRQYYRLT